MSADQKAALATATAVLVTPEAAAAAPVGAPKVELEKKIRKVTKTLRQIDGLKVRL